MPVCSMRCRKSRISDRSSGLPRHWLAFFVKICSASHPCTTARSTAFATPPATDMCAPIRMVHYKVRLKTDPSDSGDNGRMRAVTVVALLLVAVPAPAHAWGFAAHEFIMDRAIALLPPELRPFFEANRAEVVFRAIDPDLWRTVGFLEEPPNHFLDIDAYGKYPFAELPHEWDAAVLKFGKDRLIRDGLLPWRTQEEFANLRMDFEAYNRGGEYAAHDIVLFSGFIAHYVSDAHVPLHGVTNYNGQFSGQFGVHTRWETVMFERYRDRIRIAPTQIPPIHDPREFI